MRMIFQRQDEDTGEWFTEGAVESAPSGIVRTGLDGTDIGTYPLWSDSLGRTVDPSEGDVFLMALDESGSAGRGARFVLDPEKGGS